MEKNFLFPLKGIKRDNKTLKNRKLRHRLKKLGKKKMTVVHKMNYVDTKCSVRQNVEMGTTGSALATSWPPSCVKTFFYLRTEAYESTKYGFTNFLTYVKRFRCDEIDFQVRFTGIPVEKIPDSFELGAKKEYIFYGRPLSIKFKNIELPSIDVVPIELGLYQLNFGS